MHLEQTKIIRADLVAWRPDKRKQKPFMLLVLINYFFWPFWYMIVNKRVVHTNKWQQFFWSPISSETTIPWIFDVICEIVWEVLINKRASGSHHMDESYFIHAWANWKFDQLAGFTLFADTLIRYPTLSGCHGFHKLQTYGFGIWLLNRHLTLQSAWVPTALPRASRLLLSGQQHGNR